MLAVEVLEQGLEELPHLEEAEEGVLEVAYPLTELLEPQTRAVVAVAAVAVAVVIAAQAALALSS